MYIAIGLAAVFYLLIKCKTEKRELVWYGAGLMICGLILPTGILFQGFYSKSEMLWIVPLYIWIAWFLTEIATVEAKKLHAKRGRYVPVACLLIILLCGDLGLKNVTFAQNPEWKTEREITNVLAVIESEWEKDNYVTVVAPDEVQGEVRGYNAAIYTVYGRDLWEQELIPYFYDGYDEWQYLLHGYMNSKLFDIIEGEEVNAATYRSQLLELIQNSGATHVVLKKTNIIPELIMDEVKEKSVEILEYNGMELQMISKTENYFIYRVFR